MANRCEIIYIDCTSSDTEDNDEGGSVKFPEDSSGAAVGITEDDSSQDECLNPCFPAYTCEWCMSRVPDIPHPSLETFFRFELEYGRSLRTRTTIEAGEYIADYKGKRFLKPRNGPYVMEVIKGKVWVDGALGGNISCWINHSCAPNCEVYVEPITYRAMIFALEQILAGEELTFRYSEDPEDLPFDCQCKVCLAEEESEEGGGESEEECESEEGGESEERGEDGGESEEGGSESEGGKIGRAHL